MRIRYLSVTLVLGLGLILTFLYLLVFGTTVPVYADTFTVTNTEASGPGSLRQAILDANGTAGHDTVAFEEGLTGTVVLTAPLWIADDLTIAGPGADQLAISGDSVYQVFSIASGDAVTITGVTVQDGYGHSGGGIGSAGNLHLDSVHIVNNAASTRGGGVYVSQGSATLTGTHVVSNSATYGGGVCVYDGTATLTATQVFSNVASSRGGGVYVSQDGATLHVSE